MPELSLLTIADHQSWHVVLERIGIRDIMFQPCYAEVFERYGEGRAHAVVYRVGNHELLYPFILRPIDPTLLDQAGLSAGRFDLCTPYGYGGYVHNVPAAQAKPFLAGFRQAFTERMRAHGAVSEFIRFQPMLRNHLGSEGLLTSLSLHSLNIVLSLDANDDEILRRCRASYRQCIIKAKAAGLELRQGMTPEALTTFCHLYDLTMRKHNQTGYLNFPERFFTLLARALGGDLLLFSIENTGKTVASALFLRCGSYLEYFLAASDPEATAEHPNHLLIFEVAKWARSEGFKSIHLGGGSETLVFFKKGFSRDIREYFIGKHIFDQDAYERLTVAHYRCANRDWTPSSDPFFPGYRNKF
ncbi:GNAT family N-acetyltransferase [uncultured Gammaproteobacteria bacterium]|nr:GNAT family N-acetyltransferase [Pseudomonadota bacterium]